MAGLRPQFVLFGDSITQRAFGPGGWASAIADTYTRRVDVINRGYSGYNSRWALALLEHVFPPAAAADVRLATVFFGANDAALPDQPSAKQHVPLAEYVSNMRTIVSHLRSRNVSFILLITPPPIYEDGRIAYVKDTFGVTLEAPERSNAAAGTYADAVVALGTELGLPVVDLWRAFQKVEDWQTVLLNDGLHLTPAGNELVGRLVLEAVAQNFDNLRPEAIPFDVPEWGELAEIGADGDAAKAVAAYHAAKK